MHSATFIALRDAILELTDEDRRRLAALLGCMHEPQPPVSGGLARVLSAFAALDPEQRCRMSAWCAQYLSRWGQVPAAASRRVKHPKAGSCGPKPPAER
jgi:hypothetical protein